jgi:hypothetical protein
MEKLMRRKLNAEVTANFSTPIKLQMTSPRSGLELTVESIKKQSPGSHRESIKLRGNKAILQLD